MANTLTCAGCSGLLGVSSPSSGIRLLAKPLRNQGGQGHGQGMAEGLEGAEAQAPAWPPPCRGQMHIEGAWGPCRSVPTTSRTFWQPRSGQVVLFLPYPPPAFTGTWWQGQPACLRSQCQTSRLQPHSSAAQCSSVSVPPHYVAAAGKGKDLPDPHPGSGFPPPRLSPGSPRTPLEPPRLVWVGAILAAWPRQGPPGQLPGLAAGSADRALCFVMAARQRDKRVSQTRWAHCAGSHALRQQPAQPRSPHHP